MAEYTRPYLYPKQLEALFCPHRWALVEASAQPLDTLIPTPNGWKFLGELGIGDLVFAVDGSPTKVTEIVPHGVREIYRLEFTGGAVVRACGDHLWEVEHESRPGSTRVLKTSELAAFTERTRLTWKFPICGPVDYWVQPYELDPWLVGVLIGDGNICNNIISFSSADPDIVERVKTVVPRGYIVEPQTSTEYSYIIKPRQRGAGYEKPSIRFKAGKYEVSVGGTYIGRRNTYIEAFELHEDAMYAKFGEDLPDVNIRRELRNLGLLGLKHNEKFIPDLYKFNSTEVRLEMLRGLLDTDGSLSNNNAVIEQTSEKLAADITELARSLGALAKTVYQSPRKAGWKGSYRTLIRHPDVQSLFWLERKKAKHVPGLDCMRRLLSIEPDGFDTVQCIAVEHPRSLYLTSDFAVTHNTKSGKTVGCIAWILEQALAGVRGNNYWWVAPVSDQAKIAFTRVKNNLTRGSFTSLESPTPRIVLLNGTIIWFKSADNADSLYGEDVFAAVIDEASRCSAEAWYAVRSTLTATGGPARIIGNVKGRRNWFYEFARRIESGSEPNGHFSRITVVDAIDAGVIPQAEVEDARRNMPEFVFRELYMAEAADDGGNPFGLNHIANCTRPTLAPGPAVAFGVDLAKKQDWFVTIGLNKDGQVCIFERWQRVPWQESIRRVRRIVGEDTPALVDSTGVGDPVLESLQIERGNFFGRIFSAPSKQKLMEGLVVGIQSKAIGFPAGRIKTELEAFEFIERPNGSGVYYSISKDALDPHDDCVMALALAYEKFTEVVPGANVMAYMAEEVGRLSGADDEVENVRPWRSPLTVDVDDILDNELTELYNDSVAKAMPDSGRNCNVCKTPVIGSRISDGELVWHPACVPFGMRSAA